MPVTRELATEMKVLFKDFIDEFLKSEEFFNRLTDVFTKKFDEKVDHMFALYVQKYKKYNSLESELKILSNKSDELEQHTRRNNLRIIGILTLSNLNLKFYRTNLMNWNNTPGAII
ncbi:hypothetical protein QE152_g36878 [Popillia japonica]|uniref:Uncharacterized protein n=1 Tax=Popillia japonica TaxID=7064 RepID=A0AAW1ICJ3_POPJA